MTREEAIENLKGCVCGYEVGKDGKPNGNVTADLTQETIDMAIKTLESKDVLDKIRAEIDEQYDRVHPYNISCAEGLEMALGIIDKYKAESEGKG